MKKIIWLAVTGLLIFSISGFAAISDSIAVVSSHTGKVQIDSGSKVKAPEVNMPLYEGDLIRTDSKSSIEITFDDATIIRLTQNSEIKLTELKRKGSSAITVFNLAKGALLAIVDKLKTDDSRFEIHTKMAIAAVKGTEFVITANGTASACGVFEGSVEFKGDKGSVMVKTGNESAFEPALGRPLNPSGLNRTASFTYEMDGMREEVKVIRELKKRGDDSVIQYRINKQREKDGKTQTSETEITIGGANDNVKQVENEIRNRLDKKAKNELSRARGHAWKDLGHITGEMKADVHLGKTMTDRHGNRIRIEEFIFRPKDADGVSKQVDMLSVTLRDNRLDYLRAENVFANEIPENITWMQWRDMWKHEWNLRVEQPWNYLAEQRIKLSNTTDWVFMGTKYIDELWSKEIAGSNYANYKLIKEQDIVAFGSGEISGDMTVDGFAAPGSVAANPNNAFVREQRIHVYKDYLGNISRNNTETGDQNAALRGPLDKTYTGDGIRTGYEAYLAAKASYASTEYSALTGSMNIGANDFVNYSEGNELLGEERELGYMHKRRYNDGSYLAVKLALINDYGEIMKFPEPGTNTISLVLWGLNLLYNSNIEASFHSNVYEDQEMGIDVVSKMLWWIMLNPKSETSPSPANNSTLTNY